MKKVFLPIALFLAWVAFSGTILFTSAKQSGLELDFLDVGQGDASLIKTPYGQKILIDGGPDDSVLEELVKHLPLMDRRLDVVILTHQHEDHLAGLLSVLEKYQVDTVIYSSASGTKAMSEAWLSAVKKEDAKIIKPSLYDELSFGPDCRMRIINPYYFYTGRELNEYSLVSIFDCGTKVLFAGDAGKAVEKWLLDNNEDVDAEILKVGHHGSASASSEDFLSAVSPSWSIISVGSGNSYNLPKEEVVRRLLRAGSLVYRTDKAGTVSVRLNGKKLSFDQ
jgi:beta-lactamase superfamily II metal-dependent hydrolase